MNSQLDRPPVKLTAAQWEKLSLEQQTSVHSDTCICDCLGRESCLAPIHGDLWIADCIEHNERYCSELRANCRDEALEIGCENALQWGGSCIDVRKA